MHSLDSIVGGILSQLSSAQSYSDAATVTAGHKYARHQHLKFFDVPQISIFEADIDLRFAFASDNKKHVISSFNQHNKDDFICLLKTQLNELIDDKTFVELFRIGGVDPAKWSEDVDSLAAMVYHDIDGEVDIDLNQLSFSIIVLLKSRLISMFSHNTNVLAKIKQLLHFQQSKSGSDAQNKWLDELNDKIRNLLCSVLKINALDSDLSIIVSAEELSHIPDSSISKITFKTALTKKHWVHEEKEEGIKISHLAEK